MAANLSEEPWFHGGDPCEHIKPEIGRFVLVGIVGTTISIVSAFENVFLFSVWILNPHRRTSHYLYLIFLAFCDSFISISYILLIAVNVWMDWYKIKAIVDMWWLYMVPMLTVSHVTMSTSSFFITAATFERFIITLKNTWFDSITHRRFLISMICLGLGLVCKGPILLEIKVQRNGNCTGLSEYYADLSPLAKDPDYNTIYRFWFRNITTVIIPFFLCLQCNISIIKTLSKQQRKARLFRFGTTQHKVNIRSATRMLVLVVCTYLISNILNVVITAWEFIDNESLFDPKYRKFYAYSSDVISVLTVLASSLRLPIYCACNAPIRNEMRLGLRYFCKFCYSEEQRERKGNETELLIMVNGTTPMETTPVPEKKMFAGTDFDRFAVALAFTTSTLSLNQTNSTPTTPIDHIEREYLV